MQIDDFVTHYQSKSDEELLQLAEHPDLLTPEAHSALAGELTRRRLSITSALKGYPAPGRPFAGEQVSQQLSPGRPHNANEFIAEVLRLYHSHWRLFITLVAPAVVVGYTTFYLRRWLAMEIVRRIFSSQGPYTLSMIEGLSVALVGYAVSWMAFSCAFGAICFCVREIQMGFVPAVGNSFSHLRKRSSAFVRLSLLLFFLCVVANSAANLAFSGVWWLTRHFTVHVNSLTFSVMSWAFIGGALLVLSRFALAIPAVVLDNFTVAKAMFRSDELTEGKWLTLLALLSKSLIGGYLAGMCPYWLASWLLAGKSAPFDLTWLLAIISAGAITIIEPTMFVGFALLYLRTSSTNSRVGEGLSSSLVPEVRAAL